MRVMLADHRTIMRNALRMFLQEQEGIEVVAEVNRVGELMRDAPIIQPDLIFLAWDMPDFKPRGFKMRFDDTTQKAYTQMKAVVISSLHQLASKPTIAVIGAQQNERVSALTAKADVFFYQGERPSHILTALKRIQKNRN